jgi:NifU-like protein involved in Fe-S cluster formation
MQYSHEVEEMECVLKGAKHDPAPIPEEGKWVKAKQITDISGLTHGVGWCAPQQGACKLTLNVKNGVIEEALVETLGCSGMTHSAAMAAEFCPARPSSKRSTATSSATRSTPPCASCSCRSSTAAHRARFRTTACPSARV